MRVVEHPDLSEPWACPICGRGDDLPVLKPLKDWRSDGPVGMTLQVHVACLELRVMPHQERFRIESQRFDLKQEDL